MKYYNFAMERVKAKQNHTGSFEIYMEMMKITGAAQKKKQPVQMSLF